MLSVLKHKNFTSLSLFMGCLVPPVMILYLQKLGALSQQAPNNLRVGSLLIFLILIWGHLYTSRHKIIPHLKSHIPLICTLLLCGVAISLSLVVNQPEFFNIAKAGLYFTFICTLAGGVFLLLRYDALPLDFRLLSQCFIGLTLFCICINVGFHFFGNAENGKLVFPVNIDKMILLSWVLSCFYLKRPVLSAFFVLTLLWTASFVEIFFMTGLYIYAVLIKHVPFSPKKFLPTALAVLFVFWSLSQISAYNLLYPYFNLTGQLRHACIVEINCPHNISKDFTYTRTSADGNRLDIWKRTANLLTQSQKWWSGFGQERLILRPDRYHNYQQTPKSAHNAFLRATVQYGLGYALIIYILWFTVFASKTTWPIFHPLSQKAMVGFSCFWILTGLSLTHSSFWTNMSDNVALFMSIWLLHPDHTSDT